jgi:hypothetical protein
MTCKMGIFWKNLHKKPEGIVMGSSRANAGINPNLFSRHNVINMSFSGLDLAGFKNILTNYVLPHGESSKFIITTLMPGWLNYPNGNYLWKKFYISSKGYQYDKNHNFWKSGWPEKFLPAMQSITFPQISADTLGFMPHPVGKWGKAFKGPHCADFTVQSPNFMGNMKILKQIVRILEMLKIHLLIINFPVAPDFANSSLYGPYGPKNKTVVKDIFKILREMEKQSDYFHFYDANRFGQHDFTDEDSQNHGHLSAKGAAKLTPRIDSLVQTFKGL